MTNFKELESWNPLFASFVFIDDVDVLYCEADFDREGVNYCKYEEVLGKDEYPNLNIIFCKIPRWEKKNFKRAMTSLDERLKRINPNYNKIVEDLNTALEGE